MPPLIGQRTSINLETRRGTPIQNSFDETPPTPGNIFQCTALKRQYIAALHRPTNASNIYNCHGLTFACRRTGITDYRELRRIIADDTYQKIDHPKDLFPGDIVLYIQQGDLTHSGVITEVSPILRVLSKWGWCHEVVHAISDCPYIPATYEFWRIVS
jgi:hypothetical protein